MSQETANLIIFLIMFFVVGFIILRSIILYFIRGITYGGIPPASESREKMKFITILSQDEVIERLRQHDVKDVFKYELKREDDVTFTLHINGIGALNMRCLEKAKYKMVIKPEEEGTAVWIVLYEAEGKDAVERYGWELKGFMKKKIMAVRVE